jgi:carnitine O-acetyltransferase
MLRYQDNLPRLPVPRLGSTIGKYVESVEPHLSPEAFAQTSAVSEAFFWSPEAAELQRRLRTRALHPDTKSWLADWWNDTAYMGYRDPVIVYVSYFYVHVDDKRGLDQVSRAATLVKGTQIFRDLVES